MPRPTTLIAVLACLLCTGAAPAAETQDDAVTSSEEALAQYSENLQQELLRSTEPRDWVHAAFLSTPASAKDPGLRDRTLREAAAAAPDDVYVQWIRAGTTDAADGQCSNEALHADRVDALVRLDPDNAAAWMVRLGLAQDEHDTLGIDAALARMAAAPRFDPHLQTAFDDWMAIVARHPLPALSVETTRLPRGTEARTFALAAGWTFSQSFVEAPLHYKYLMQACRADPAQPLSSTRRGSCVEIGRHLLHRTGTLIQQRVGAAVLRTQDALDDADRDVIRQLDWQGRAMRRIAAEPDADLVAFARDQVTGINDESSIIRGRLRRAGIPDTAPEGWTADAPTPQKPESSSDAD